MRKQMVIGFVAENANNALQACTDGMGILFRDHGYEAITLNLLHPGCYDLLRKYGSENEIAFCYGYAGIGAHIEADGVSLWEKTSIPFLSLMYDHPFYYPKHHMAPTKYVCNCYGIRDFLEVQRDYIKSPQPNIELKVFSQGYANSSKNGPLQECWAERDIGGIFLKSGYNLKPIEDSFNAMPAIYRSTVWDCIKVAQKNSDLKLTDQVHARLLSQGIDYREGGKLWDDFVYMVRVIDQYLRHWRSNQLVEKLKHLPVLVIGDGWDHINKENANASFVSAMPMIEARNLIKRAKFILNTHPYARYGWHERVFFAFETGMRVITDRSRFTDEHFADLPSYFGFDWSDQDWSSKVAEHIDSFQHKYFDFVPIQKRLQEQFPREAMMNQMIEIASKIRNSESF